MDHKIKFLDDFSMDRKLYWRVGDVYGRYDWEIMYEKDRPEGPWRLRRSGADVWFSVDGKNLFCELSARQIDVSDFDRQLCSNILTQAIFSSSLFEEAKKILGEQTISEAIVQHNQFAEELLKMIKDLTGTASDHHSVHSDSSASSTNKTQKSLVESSKNKVEDISVKNRTDVAENRSNPRNQASETGVKLPSSHSVDYSTKQTTNNTKTHTKTHMDPRLPGNHSKSHNNDSHQPSKNHHSQIGQQGKKPFLRLVRD